MAHKDGLERFGRGRQCIKHQSRICLHRIFFDQERGEIECQLGPGLHSLVCRLGLEGGMKDGQKTIGR